MDESSKTPKAGAGKSPNVKVFEPHTFLCKQGEEVEALYVLKKGRVKVIITPSSGGIPDVHQILEEGVVLSEIYTPGDLVGEMGIFTDKRNASILAAEETRVLHLDEDVDLVDGRERGVDPRAQRV